MSTLGIINPIETNHTGDILSESLVRSMSCIKTQRPYNFWKSKRAGPRNFPTVDGDGPWLYILSLSVISRVFRYTIIEEICHESACRWESTKWERTPVSFYGG